MRKEAEILKDGLKVLKGLGLQAERREAPRHIRADLVLDLTAKNGGPPQRYYVEVKSRINNAVILQSMIDPRKRYAVVEKPALLTEHIPPVIGERLREMGISYFDTAGNAYFNNPSFYIDVSGKKPERRSAPKIPSIFRPAGIKLVLRLLSDPGIEARDYREMAELTGIPKTTVGELMANLKMLKFLVTHRGERRLTNKPELLRRWVEAFAENFRPKQVRNRFRARDGDTDWWNTASIADYKACWGGEIAARKLVGHIKPKTATIYADSLLPRLQAKYGLRRDDDGDVEILNKFWPGPADETAPPLIVYADLISTGDPRNLETARLIHEKYLARLIEDTAA